MNRFNMGIGSGGSFNAEDMAFGNITPPGMTRPSYSQGGSSFDAARGSLGAGVQAPKTDPVSQPGMFDRMGGIEGIGSILQGLGSMGQIYASLKGLGLAKKQLNFSKKAWETNLANQTQSYNTSLEDRTRARKHAQGQGADAVDAYLAKHML